MTRRVNYPSARIRDLCEITSSKRIFAADYTSEGVPFYRGKEITEKHRGGLAVNTELFISREQFEGIKAKFGAPEAGDLLLTSVGTLGSPYVVAPREEFYFKDGNITWFRNFRNLNPYFLYYWICSPSGKAELQKCTIGSSQSAYTIVLLKEMQIDLPTLDVQRRIASILSAYDDLIQVNARRIAILEEMVYRIFEDWFVRFRFPGHDNSGAKPNDWIPNALGEVLETLESGSRPKGGVGSDGDIPSIGAENVIGLGRYDYQKEKRISRAFFSTMRRGHVRHGDVMLYKDGAYIGRLSLAWNGFPHHECVVNEHVFLLRPKLTVPAQFLYFWLDQAELQAKIRGLNANAAQPGINQSGVRGLPITLPPPSLLKRFQVVTGPIMDLLFNLARQNPKLRAARDLLLPKLISGEIDLAHGERGLQSTANRDASE